MIGAVMIALAGSFWLRSFADSRLTDVEAALSRELIFGELETPIASTGCRGSDPAILPFGSNEGGELQRTPTVFESFYSDKALARFSYEPVIFGNSSGAADTDLGLANLAIRKDLRVELLLIEGDWCIDRIQLEADVVSRVGSVSDEELVEMAMLASGSAQPTSTSTAGVLSDIRGCGCLSVAEESLIADYLEVAVWPAAEDR